MNYLNKSGIYCIKNKVNNKVYIGSAVNFRTRFISHRTNLNNNKKQPNRYLQFAWNKYEESNFEFIILEYVENRKDLRNVEQKWMDKLNVLDKNYGYNICPKAENSSGYKHTEDALKKMKKTQSNRKPISEETRKRMSKAQKGLKLGKNHPNYGKTMSEETKKKIGKGNKGHTKSRGENNPAAKYNELQVRTYRRAVEFGMKRMEICRLLNIPKSTMNNMINKSSWKYIYKTGN